MLNSDVLEVAIGLVFIYLLLSLIATSAREALEGVLKTRSKSLESGLVELFDATRQPQLLQAFYDHPLISGLYRGDYALPPELKKKLADAATTGGAALQAGAGAATEAAGAAQAVAANPSAAADAALPVLEAAAANVLASEREVFDRLLGGKAPAIAASARQLVANKLPSYIPPSSFALALLDMVARRNPAVSKTPADVAAVAAAARDAAPMTMAMLQDAAKDLLEGTFADAVRLAIKSSSSLDEAQAFLEDWFNGAMDRVSGIYKRYTQGILLVLSAVICILLNVNTLVIAQALAQNPTLRAAVAADAQGAATNPDFTNALTSSNSAEATNAINTQVDQIERIEGLPIGWGGAAVSHLKALFPAHANFVQWLISALEVLAGWLITAFAIMLGAPFWFDVLGKIMVIRSTVKPAEKSGVEASKDAT